MELHPPRFEVAALGEATGLSLRAEIIDRRLLPNPLDDSRQNIQKKKWFTRGCQWKKPKKKGTPRVASRRTSEFQSKNAQSPDAFDVRRRGSATP
jgi:hypothetical protein